MKSLEIIDKYIGTVYALSDDELKQIQRDLRILEIIKKHYTHIIESETNVSQIFTKSTNEYIMILDTLVRKDYEFLKKWLEE